MGHGRRPLLSFLKCFLSFPNFGPLPMPHLESHLLESGSNDCQRTEILGIAITLNDLGGNLGGLEAQFLANALFDIRIEMCKSPHSPADLANRHRFFRPLQPSQVT